MASMRVKLTATLAGVLVLPAVAVGMFSYETAASNARNELIQSETQSVQMANSIIDQFVTNTKYQVSDLSSSVNDAMSRGNQTSVDNLLGEFEGSNPNMKATYLAMPNGQFEQYPHVPLPAGYDPRFSDWYKEASAAPDKVIVTQAYPDVSTGHMIVTIAKELANHKGVVGVDVDTDTIEQLLKTVKVGQKGYIAVVSQKEEAVADPAVKPGTLVQVSWLQQMLKERNGQMQYSFQGSNKEGVFVTNPTTDWLVLGVLFDSEITASALPVLYTTLGVLIIALILGGAVSAYILMNVNKSFKKLLDASNRINKGDLTTDIQIVGNDEFAKLSKSFNDMTGSLRNVIGKVHETADQLAASAEELNASSEETTRSAEHLSASVQEIVAGTAEHGENTKQAMHSMTELAANVQQVASSAQEIAHGAEEASVLSSQGNESVSHAVSQMEAIHTTVNSLSGTVSSLGKHSTEISNIVETISQIADQTNLLALNAAIEAARAGDAGKGFAVVADEVRKLARDSGESAKHVAEYVSVIRQDIEVAIRSMEESKDVVSGGIEAVNKAGQSLEMINSAVSGVTKQIDEASAATEHMRNESDTAAEEIKKLAEVAKVVGESIYSVSAISEEQVATMEEVAASSASLARLAEELQVTISKFKM